MLANTFLWPRGYTTVWSGWENNLGPLTGLTATATFPIAGPGGSTITGPSYEYIVTGGSSFALSMPPLPEPRPAERNVDPPRPPQRPAGRRPSRMGLHQCDQHGHQIEFAALDAANFVANDIYEFSYIAKDPTVNGLGFAAVRDFNSFLRYATHRRFRHAKSARGRHHAYLYGNLVAAGRTLNDFVHLGFNEDENGRKVFDGMLQWVAAGDGINMNYRWSQTKRTNRNRRICCISKACSRSRTRRLFDPISGTTDGRYKKCDETNTCPLAMEFYSSNEYWVKAASLMHTDPMGKEDLPDHPKARLYLLSSKQHGGAGNPTSKGICQQFLNPLIRRRCSARFGKRWTSGRRSGIAAAAVAGSKAQGRDAGAAVAAVGGRDSRIFPASPTPV